jgi:predicted ATPase
VTAAQEDLEKQILDAHARDDHDQLCRLYLQAGQLKEAGSEIDAACFLYTQAYVYGLETGNPALREAHQRLVRYGREE